MEYHQTHSNEKQLTIFGSIMIIQKTSHLIGYVILLAAMQGNARDLSTDVRNGTHSPSRTDDSYIELGMGVNVGTNPFYGIPEGNEKDEIATELKVGINLHLQYHGWFMETFSDSLEGGTLGYNFTNTDKWSFDVVALPQHQELSKKISKDLAGIRTRHMDFMSGPRATGYLGNYIVQLHALTDISNTHKGQVLSAKIARHWQYKNWNFHAIGGLSYRSDRVADYYLSIEPEDATPKFSTFQAQGGFVQVYEIGVTYPLSKKWVFRTSLQHYQLDSRWSKSPLLVSTNASEILTSINFVF
jgi:MipA family protein